MAGTGKSKSEKANSDEPGLDDKDIQTDAAKREDSKSSDLPELEAADEPGPQGPDQPDHKDAPYEPGAADEQPTLREPGHKRVGFAGAVLGGVCAAALGFLAARTELIDPVLPESWRMQDSSAALEELNAKLGQQDRKIVSVQDELNKLSIPSLPERVSKATAKVDELSGDIAELQKEMAGLSDRLATLDLRLSEVEMRSVPDGVPQADSSAYESELAALKESLSEQMAEVQALISDAQAMEQKAREIEAEAAESARLGAALTIAARLRSALDTGDPFDALLDQMSDNGVEISADLSRHAATGVPTLASLQESFPDVARETLALARSKESDGDSGFGAFLARQFGARSVVPREGDDPDAVLSRAEAALTQGNLQLTLSELSSLPEDARTAIGDWEARANARLSALQAAQALTDSLSAN